MKLLEEKMKKDGCVLAGEVLKVDGFLNHNIDVDFLLELGREFYQLFQNEKITKILTVEASGIGIACITAQYFHVPVLFAKKCAATTENPNCYIAEVNASGKNASGIYVSKEYLGAEDRVLVLDDFLAQGHSLQALLGLIEQAGASCVGCGIVIEKAYQGGGNELRAKGIRVESLAKIAAMSVENGFVFTE